MHSHLFILDASSINDDGHAVISGQDAKHIARSLRLKTNDKITVSDGEAFMYEVELRSVEPDKVIGQVVVKHAISAPERKLTVYQGLPKGRKMDLITEKLTELGAARIIPVIMARSVPEPGESGAKHAARWRRIAREASKQSRRMLVPEVGEIAAWGEALEEMKAEDALLVPYEEETNRGLSKVFEGRPKKVGVVIGPEGGFEDDEIKSLRALGARTFTFGPNILRTETAAIAAAALILDRMKD